MNLEELDGRIGDGWGGVKPNGSHVNVVLARRGSPTAAAAIGMLAHPTPGHTPVLVCVGETEQERDAGATSARVRAQLAGALDDSTSGNLHLWPGSARDVINDAPDAYDEHNGGTLRFGADFAAARRTGASSTSTMTSISTGMPRGSEPMPTAERACRPRSPNTDTKRSEQPLITSG